MVENHDIHWGLHVFLHYVHYIKKNNNLINDYFQYIRQHRRNKIGLGSYNKKKTRFRFRYHNTLFLYKSPESYKSILMFYSSILMVQIRIFQIGRKFFILFYCYTYATMVFILDGNSHYVVHTWRKIGHFNETPLICD